MSEEKLGSNLVQTWYYILYWCENIPWMNSCWGPSIFYPLQANLHKNGNPRGCSLPKQSWPCEVTWKQQKLKFAVKFCGTKGDWPFLRACYQLQTGYTSKRICHLCEAKDACPQFVFIATMSPKRLNNPTNIGIFGACSLLAIVSLQLTSRVLTQDWVDLSQSGSTRRWSRNRVAPSPFKRGQKAAIRLIPPHGNDPSMIKIDIAHTFAIAGYGKDQYASTLVFLAVRCAIWGAASYPQQLERAYGDFKSWCVANGKRTTIDEFSKKELKILSRLV